MTALAQKPLPDHVPAHLAMALPLFARKVTYDNPQDVLIPQMHAELPPITYVTNIFPGDQPGWLLKNADDVQAMLQAAAAVRAAPRRSDAASARARAIGVKLLRQELISLRDELAQTLAGLQPQQQTPPPEAAEQREESG